MMKKQLFKFHNQWAGIVFLLKIEIQSNRVLSEAKMCRFTDGINAVKIETVITAQISIILWVFSLSILAIVWGPAIIGVMSFLRM